MTSNEVFKELLELGWVIQLTSCTCGGRYAWMKPRLSGSMEMVGCICHSNPFKLLYNYKEDINRSKINTCPWCGCKMTYSIQMKGWIITNITPHGYQCPLGMISLGHRYNSSEEALEHWNNYKKDK